MIITIVFFMVFVLLSLLSAICPKSNDFGMQNARGSPKGSQEPRSPARPTWAGTRIEGRTKSIAYLADPGYPIARLQTGGSHNRKRGLEMLKLLCLLLVLAISVGGCFGGSGSNVDCSQGLEAVCGPQPDLSNETAMNQWMDCASSYTAQCPPRGLDAYPFPCFFVPAVVMAISLLSFRRENVFCLSQE